MVRSVFFALATLAALAATPASAEWREASSDHFIIYADASEKWLRGFSERLEKFDSGMRALRRMESPPEARSNRLTIYVVSHMGEVSKLCGKKCNAAGFYIPRAGGSIAFTPRVPKDDYTNFEDVVLFHEYTHHFLLENFSDTYPRWFNEGFAEFNGTAAFGSDGSMSYGLPAQHRTYGLYNTEAIPIETVLDPTPEAMKRFNRETWDAFYGRAWLLTHLLTIDSSRSGQLGKYLALMSQGKPSLVAAREAFGELKQLQSDLERYRRANSFVSQKIPPSMLKVGAIGVRLLSEGEARMIPVRMRSDRGVDHDQAVALVPDARKRAAAYPNDPRVQAALAEAEYDAGNLAEAEAAADRALAADPHLREAMLYKGRVHVALAAKQSDAKPQVWAEARSWYIKANKEDTNAAEPLMLFYASYAAAGQKPTANAAQALQRAFELSPQDFGLRWMLALQLLADNRTADARVVLGPLAYDPHGGGGEASPAMRLITLIDSGAKGPEALAALSEGEKNPSGAAKGPGDGGKPAGKPDDAKPDD